MASCLNTLEPNVLSFSSFSLQTIQIEKILRKFDTE